MLQCYRLTTLNSLLAEWPQAEWGTCRCQDYTGASFERDLNSYSSMLPHIALAPLNATRGARFSRGLWPPQRDVGLRSPRRRVADRSRGWTATTPRTTGQQLAKASPRLPSSSVDAAPLKPGQGCASQLDAGCRCRRFRYRLEASQRGRHLCGPAGEPSAGYPRRVANRRATRRRRRRSQERTGGVPQGRSAPSSFPSSPFPAR